jgi:hypothetical protein
VWQMTVFIAARFSGIEQVKGRYSKDWPPGDR